MLSILIPVYNYNISSLVLEVHEQATKANIKFEIICFDDNSEKHTLENKSIIGSLPDSKIIISKDNVGRIKARQMLSNASIYSWLLFLDADVRLKSKTFIERYIVNIDSEYEVIFGGFAYTDIKPENNAVLRWKYGKAYEEVDAKKRNLKPYQLIISANCFIKKNVFNKINRKINKKGYGLDNYFAALLKQNNIKVLHLNNEVYHFGIENSTTYLNKAEECIITLLWLYDGGKMQKHNNKLLTAFVVFKQLKANYFMAFFYKNFKAAMKKNLLGPNPNMLLLQMYKLSYICNKDLN